MAKAKPTTGLGRRETGSVIPEWLFQNTGWLYGADADDAVKVSDMRFSRSVSVALEEGEELVSYAVRKADGSIDVRPA